jgi:hypothetical protein
MDAARNWQVFERAPFRPQRPFQCDRSRSTRPACNRSPSSTRADTTNVRGPTTAAVRSVRITGSQSASQDCWLAEFAEPTDGSISTHRCTTMHAGRILCLLAECFGFGTRTTRRTPHLWSLRLHSKPRTRNSSPDQTSPPGEHSRAAAPDPGGRASGVEYLECGNWGGAAAITMAGHGQL